MKKFIKNYQKNFVDVINSTEVTGNHGNKLDVHKAIEAVIDIIKSQSKIGRKVFFIGNGGSAAIASHMAIDFWKNGGIKSMAFNDSSLLTCIGNDFGYEYIFEKPIEFFADRSDVLFAISSSGKSINILKGVEAAKLKRCKVITFSGFNKANPLRSMGDYNFYIPSDKYGIVEVIHQYVCHFILDVILEEKGECKR